MAYKVLLTPAAEEDLQHIVAYHVKDSKLPSAEEFEASLDDAQKWAASVGYSEDDVDNIIKSVRKRRK